MGVRCVVQAGAASSVAEPAATVALFPILKLKSERTDNISREKPRLAFVPVLIS